MVDLRTLGELGVWCADVVDAVVKGNAEVRRLLGQRDLQAFDAEYYPGQRGSRSQPL